MLVAVVLGLDVVAVPVAFALLLVLLLTVVVVVVVVGFVLVAVTKVIGCSGSGCCWFGPRLGGVDVVIIKSELEDREDPTGDVIIVDGGDAKTFEQSTSTAAAVALVAAAAVAAPQSFWPFQPALMALLLSPPAVPLLETPTVLFCPVPAARPATVLLSWIGCVTFG